MKITQKTIAIRKLKEKLERAEKEKADLLAALEHKQKTNENIYKSNEQLHNRNMLLSKRLADELEFSARAIRQTF